ncbi:gluconate 2-dehydrogenase subunit 3 family protein [Fibrella arboris]|uniref:gluconate 2-dehydrogenase subunit 3 family protein n=1 Tax=Fibrella arboris TaxID=3242486 RepID=UPI003521C3C5
MNQSPPYPVGTVRALLTTEHVSAKTREVLLERLTYQRGPYRFFSPEEATTLQQMADRLIPQTGYVVDLVGPVDERLAAGETDGWRYDTMPADTDAYRQGIQGLHESAQTLFGQPFDQLTTTQQDELLGQIQQGTAPGDSWQRLAADRFFEEVLAELVGIYYSHPLVQEAFGYVGMADKPGWELIGLDQLETREPKEP